MSFQISYLSNSELEPDLRESGNARPNDPNNDNPIRSVKVNFRLYRNFQLALFKTVYDNDLHGVKTYG